MALFIRSVDLGWSSWQIHTFDYGWMKYSDNTVRFVMFWCRKVNFNIVLIRKFCHCYIIRTIWPYVSANSNGFRELHSAFSCKEVCFSFNHPFEICSQNIGAIQIKADIFNHRPFPTSDHKSKPWFPQIPWFPKEYDEVRQSKNQVHTNFEVIHLQKIGSLLSTREIAITESFQILKTASTVVSANKVLACPHSSK